MFRVKPRVTLGLMFFTVLIQKSEKQWKVFSGCLKNLPSQTTTVDFPLFKPPSSVGRVGIGGSSREKSESINTEEKRSSRRSRRGDVYRK